MKWFQLVFDVFILIFPKTYSYANKDILIRLPNITLDYWSQQRVSFFHFLCGLEFQNFPINVGAEVLVVMCSDSSGLVFQQVELVQAAVDG